MALLLLLVAMVPIAPATQVRGETTETALHSWLDNLFQSSQTVRRPQRVIPIDDRNLGAVFPRDRFYGIYFGRWPRPPSASELPKELSPETVVRIEEGKQPQSIREGTLGNFLLQALENVRDDSQARTAVLASLRLAEAGSRAGESSFDQPNVSVMRQGSVIIANARAAAQAPSRGEVEIHLNFKSDGKVDPNSIRIEDRTRPGPP
jgi:hypothetical protein